MTTVGYGEIYPETTEGRIVATLLLFAGILTFFGFLSTIASKIIKPTLEVKVKKDKYEKKYKHNKDRKTIHNKGEGIPSDLQNYETKNWIKDQIDNIEAMDKSDFTNLILTLVDYYEDNGLIRE